MIDLITNFIVNAAAILFFVTAISNYTYSVESIENQIRAAREVVVDDAVYAQRVGVEPYSESKTGAAIVSEILSRPEYRIVVIDGVSKTAYRWFSDGSLLVMHDTLNPAPGVESGYSELYYSMDDFINLVLIGEYSMKIEYDAGSAQITEVVYTK